MEPNVWVVFQWQADEFNNGVMLPCVVGAFSSTDEAEAACNTETHYIFPLVMNQVNDGDPELHALAYYPRCRWRTEQNQKDAANEREKRGPR